MLDCLESTPGTDATATVIWMHGLGASGADFIPLVPLMGLPTVRFVFPHAPERPVTINGGYVMPAWYDILSMERGPDREAPDDIRASALEIEALIAREHARGVPSERIVLAGFSQGAAMALHVGLRHRHRLAGILILSGYLLLGDRVADEAHPANADTPLFFGHGRSDDVVPLELGRRAHDRLDGGSHPLEWRDYPMAHELCHDEVRDLRVWLHAALGEGGGD